MKPLVQEMELVPAEPQLPAVPAEPSMSMFERFARDPNVDVDKLERLVQMQERAEARNYEQSFNAAMSEAQQEMRPIATDADNPQTRSRYASYAALDRALRPIYTKHGFGLSFNTGDCPLPEHVRVLCDVTHTGGHSKLYRIDMPADGKGAKGGDVMTKTHATGAATSYGMRYLLKMIFNVAVGEDDDDGNRASTKKPAPTTPAGYDDWMADMTATADEGIDRLKAAWASSPVLYRNYTATHNKAKWADLKARASAASKGGR